MKKKNQKNPEYQFFIKFEKSHFGPISAPSYMKTSKQKFLPKKFSDSFKTLCCCNFTKKKRNEKFLMTIFQNT